MTEAGPRPPDEQALLERIRGPRHGWWRLALFAVATLGVLFGLTRLLRIDLEATIARVRSGDPWLLAAGVAVTVFFPILSAFRFRRVLGALGHEVSFRRCFDSIMAAWPLGTVTPSKTGDFFKAWYLRDEVPVPRVLGSVLAERLLDVLVLLLLATLGMAAYAKYSFAAVTGGAFLVGIASVAVLARVSLPVPDKWRAKLDGLLASLRLLARSPQLLAEVSVFTAANWLASVAQLLLFYLALDVSIPPLYAVGALPLAIFVGLLPVTLSGMGTRDSALIFLFAPYASAETTFGVGLLYGLCGYWLPALIGLAFLRRAMPR